jgi:diketogulonate reductase-like aldo/keto reductase
VIREISKDHGKTAAQVALKWLIQQPDISVVPRALEYAEIEENIDIFDFDLSGDEMTRISALRRPVWDKA